MASNSKRYDVAIIGAGVSGLAAGIRLAHYNKKVCILERHSVVGGLNSYYRKHGLSFDVGLHAMTNFATPRQKNAPLSRLLRQLRLRHAALELYEQGHSLIRFPGAELRFGNEFEEFEANIARLFPNQIDGFRRLVQLIREHDTFALRSQPMSARTVLKRHITDPLLQDMLLCPLMFYGNAAERDMDFTQFCVMFHSIFFEGFCRPRHGVRQILDLLVQRYQECGGELRLRCGVRSLAADGNAVEALQLDDGDELRADAVLSSAGLVETLRLCRPELPETAALPVGQMSFVETIFGLSAPAAEFGHDASIVFYNDAPRFSFERPSCRVDYRSGVLCVPTNFRIPPEDDNAERIRITHIADSAAWLGLAPDEYARAKQEAQQNQRLLLERAACGISNAISYSDMFTPKTIIRYTGHLNGAVYGTPAKTKDGSTPLPNLFICGTDQGFLGIVGAMLSGISIVNHHLLK